MVYFGETNKQTNKQKQNKTKQNKTIQYKTKNKTKRKQKTQNLKCIPYAQPIPLSLPWNKTQIVVFRNKYWFNFNYHAIIVNETFLYKGAQSEHNQSGSVR